MADTPLDLSPKRLKQIKENLAQLRAQSVVRFRRRLVTGFQRTCPICGYKGEFAPVGDPPRFDGLCPSCRSRERHRLFKLWLDREKRINSSTRVLHFAPEPASVPILKGLAKAYVSADLMMDQADLKLNIEDIDLADGAFDVIIAHQILEHVDHHKALAECFRCLSPGGVLVATTPIVEGWAETYSNSDVQTPKDRLLHFGQRDHTRIFGRDLKDHMRAAGFELQEYVAVEPDVSTYALMRGEALFVLTKPKPEKPAKQQVSKKTKKG
jgi:SAM-dependent methyltransferase